MKRMNTMKLLSIINRLNNQHTMILNNITPNDMKQKSLMILFTPSILKWN